MGNHKQGRNLSLEEMDKQSLLHPYTSITDHLKTWANGDRKRPRGSRDRYYWGGIISMRWVASGALILDMVAKKWWMP
ncbi:MAG: hypothetical protein CM1200mP4_3260 [Rhodospirillaceae bacterium]|nr:MAG: hypothetical protein CM1200mP4_3260 [Rhodospirillaceae bacterium]